MRTDHTSTDRALQAYSTVPDATELQKVWPHNMHLSRARDKSVIRFEAWGSADVAAIEQSWGSENGEGRLGAAFLYLEELQNLELVELSYREAQVRHVLLLVDAGGMSTAHAGLLRYLRSVREANAPQLLRAYPHPSLHSSCMFPSCLA